MPGCNFVLVADHRGINVFKTIVIPYNIFDLGPAIYSDVNMHHTSRNFKPYKACKLTESWQKLSVIT